MAILPLSDAREKVKRAREQLAELDALITPSNPDANRILVDYDPKQRCHVVRAVVGEWPPRRTSFVAGEAIHSLRSALDYIAWQLAIAHKGREPTEKEAHQISVEGLRPTTLMQGRRRHQIAASPELWKVWLCVSYRPSNLLAKIVLSMEFIQSE